MVEFGESDVPLTKSVIVKDKPVALQMIGDFLSLLTVIDRSSASTITEAGIIQNMIDGDTATNFDMRSTVEPQTITIKFTLPFEEIIQTVTSLNYAFRLSTGGTAGSTVVVAVSDDDDNYTTISSDTVAASADETFSYSFGDKRFRFVRFTCTHLQIANVLQIFMVNLFR